MLKKSSSPELLFSIGSGFGQVELHMYPDIQCILYTMHGVSPTPHLQLAMARNSGPEAGDFWTKFDAPYGPYTTKFACITTAMRWFLSGVNS